MRWLAFIWCLVFAAFSLSAVTMNAVCRTQSPIGVNDGSTIEWKPHGPDMSGAYGRFNGLGALDAVSPYLNLFEPFVSDERGNILAVVTNGGMRWNPARSTGYGVVPGYQPLPLANGANISLASAWRGHWADITGLYNIGLRPFDPVSGRWITFDPVFDESNPNGFSAFGGDPIDGFDSDGRCMETGLNFGAHAFDTVWNTVMTTLFTPAPVQEAPPDAQQRMGQNFLDSGIGSPMKNWLGIDYSPNAAVDSIPTTFGPLIQNAINSFGVGQTTAAIPNVDVQTEPAPTLQDYLPAAQTILDNTKAQYGNVEAYNMAGAGYTPILPPYDGQTTVGVLITDEGQVVPLQSGNPDPQYANYPAAGHVEGKAAIWIRQNNSTGGIVYHNNPGGTCGLCNANIQTLLPENSILTVVPPENAVPANPWASALPTTYVGSSSVPKQNQN